MRNCIMNKLLETYIKRCIILAEQRTGTGGNNIIKAIINKFPSEYALAPAFTLAPALAVALAFAKQRAFWERYNTDAGFRNMMRSSYVYKKRSYFDFWLISSEFSEYLRPELQRAELLVIEEDKASAVTVNDVSSALEIAENVEEFIEMVKTLR